MPITRTDTLKANEGEPDGSPNNLKIAICLSGLTKNHENCLYSIKEKFSKYDPDIYCVTYGKENENIISSLNPKRSLIIDYTIVEPMLRLDYVNIMSNNGIVKYHNINGPNPNDLSILSMFFGMFMVNNLRNSTGIRYDIVVRMRYDSIIFNMNDLSDYDLNKINVPAGLDNDGINDQFAFGPEELMNDYFTVYENITGYAKECLKYRAELLLLTHLKAKGLLNKISRPDMTVAISAR